MTLKIGSLFSGYMGLDMAVEAVLDAETAWFVEYDKAPSKILAHHRPGVPNYGDVTAVKWTPDCRNCGGRTKVRHFDDVKDYCCEECPAAWIVESRFAGEGGDRIPEPVDIITGGSPCQDLSHAGKRQGMTEGTRSNLWVAMREAIAQLRPGLVVWENVRGAYSAAADSELEPCAGCVGDGSGVHLRALGRVLGDLSDLGYDCRWHGLRAADVGAPHGRFRVFVVATDSRSLRRGAGWPAVTGEADGGRAPADAAGRGLLPTPTSRDYKGHNQRGDDTCLTGALLPTPRASDGEKGGPNQRGSSGDLMLPSAVMPLVQVNDRDALGGDAVRDGVGVGSPSTGDEFDASSGESFADDRLDFGRSLCGLSGGDDGECVHAETISAGISVVNKPAVKGQRLLATPTVAVATGGAPQDSRGKRDLRLDIVAEWGQYADAIARWEALTRPAPPPTQPSKKGTPQLSPAFSEWLMGLPEGHVTGVPGLSRNDQLKALGNGVVWQQAAAAIRYLLSIQENAA